VGRAIEPTTVVIIGSLAAGRNRGADRPPRVPVAWTAAGDAFAAAPGDAVLELSPADFGSRQALRETLRSARSAHPDLAAVIVRGGPAPHPGVLAENGIRVALVEEFGAAAAPSRRPPPAGWSCRSAVWGLWEVKLSPPQRGWRRLVRGTALPALRPGSLAVVDADGMRRERGDRGLADCLSWAERARANGAAVLAGVDDLTALLEGGATAGSGRRGSVLKAA